jgi:hypothetical protein
MKNGIRKWIWVWKLYVNYGQGNELECIELTYKDYKENRKQYRENCQYPHYWKYGKILNPDYPA